MLPGNFPYYLGFLHSCQFGGAMIFLTKFALAWPFVFHFSNGLRHLAWDMGKGFENKEVSMSGWTVVSVATLLSIVLAAM